MNPKHLSGTPCWYTPMDIVLRAKQVMGTFELDPASDAFGNSRVGARTYYTELADGLSKPWGGRTAPAETVTLFFEAFHTLGAVLMPQMRLAKVAF